MGDYGVGYTLRSRGSKYHPTGHVGGYDDPEISPFSLQFSGKPESFFAAKNPILSLLRVPDVVSCKNHIIFHKSVLESASYSPK